MDHTKDQITLLTSMLYISLLEHLRFISSFVDIGIQSDPPQIYYGASVSAQHS